MVTLGGDDLVDVGLLTAAVDARLVHIVLPGSDRDSLWDVQFVLLNSSMASETGLSS